jgi:ABC-type uncharacterized transport system substrate-binding protein
LPVIHFARRLVAVCGLAAPLLAAGPASAHPHVWVTAKAEIVFDGKGEITAIRHIWQFDPDFTAYATLNLDTKHDGKLTLAELQPLADTNMEALKDYDFFTLFYVGTKRLAFAKPTEYWLDFHGGRLTLFYTLPLKQPLALKGDAMIEIGDPEYFVAMTFVKGQEVKLDGAPNGCTATYTPPHDLDAQTMAMLGSIPASQHDLPPELVQAAARLSNVVQLHCPKTGDAANQAPARDLAPAAAKPAAASMPPSTLRPSEDILARGDMLTTTAPAGAPPKTPAPAPVRAPASAPEHVVILSQNGAPPPAPLADSAVEAPVPPSSRPADDHPAGFWGWLSGIWRGVFR